MNTNSIENKTTATQNKTTSKIFRTSLMAASLLGLLLVAGPTSAASACKGLANSACSNSASCGWVEGYQRKDGRSVKSFCRAKPASNKAVSKKPAKKRVKSTVASN